MNKLILASAALIVLGGTPVLAQTVVEKSTSVNPDTGSVTERTTTVEKNPGGTGVGALGGAAAGAVVAGPVGAVVGGLAGAVTGHAVAPPTEVRTYVTTHGAPVAYDGEVVVGHPVTGEVAWLDVPRYPKYRWAYLGDKRVVIDADTHKVVAVY